MPVTAEVMSDAVRQAWRSVRDYSRHSKVDLNGVADFIRRSAGDAHIVDVDVDPENSGLLRSHQSRTREADTRLQVAREGARARQRFVPPDSVIAGERKATLATIRAGWNKLSDEDRQRFIDAANDAMTRTLDPAVASIIHRTGHLDDILEAGHLKSEYEVGRSAPPFGKSRRAKAESVWFGKPGPDDAPQIYAAVEYKDVVGAEWLPALGPAGAALYMKPPVFGRVTVTVGDSVDNASTVFPGHPQKRSDPDRQLFASPGLFNRHVDPAASRQDNAEAMFQAFRDFSKGGPWGHEYIEAQIHGGVLLSDIDKVVFNAPPKSDTIAKLESFGIGWEVRQ